LARHKLANDRRHCRMGRRALFEITLQGRRDLDFFVVVVVVMPSIWQLNCRMSSSRELRMYRVEVKSLLGGGDWFATKDEALQFAWGKGKTLLAMPKGAVNPSDWALSINGEMWSFCDLEKHALRYNYLFDEEV
jgi:hypothetical protein